MASSQAGSEAAGLVELLGGRRAFAGPIETRQQLRQALRGGFPYASFESVRAALDVNAKGLASLLGVAERTLTRRRSAQILSPVESDRLYRVARIANHASTVLGSLDRARRWLRAPHVELGGEAPLDLLDTEIGERQVEEILDRIDHGVHG